MNGWKEERRNEEGWMDGRRKEEGRNKGRVEEPEDKYMGEKLRVEKFHNPIFIFFYIRSAIPRTTSDHIDGD